MRFPGLRFTDEDEDEVQVHTSAPSQEPAPAPAIDTPSRVVVIRSVPLAEIARIWMEEHPEAMALYESLALTAASRGRKFGISLLTEKIRWEYNIIRDDASYKIPNNHRAYIARELISRHPELARLIECHRISEDDPMPF